MTAIALGESSPQYEPFVSWYRKRPTQLAFAASLVLHALLIAVIPGFRSVPLETPSVLTVQIVNEEPAPVQVPDRPAVVRDQEPLPEPVAPPDLIAPVPPPRLMEQTPVLPRPAIEPQPLPVVRQPESPAVEPVARAELVPSVPRQKPQVQPIIVKRPELAPEQPVVPVIESEPVAQVEEPVRQRVEVRREPRVVQPTQSPVRPQPRPDAPTPEVITPIARPVQIRPSVTAAPPPEAAPVKRVAPQVLAATAPPVTAAPVKPSAPALVSAPAPAPSPRSAPVIETVEPSVLEAYRQSVSQEVMRHMSYPRVAVLRKWQGKTVVEMQLSADGEVTQLLVAESSGKDVLDDEAIKMVRRSLPLPKPPRGVRTVKVPVVFRLQG